MHSVSFGVVLETAGWYAEQGITQINVPSCEAHKLWPNLLSHKSTPAVREQSGGELSAFSTCNCYAWGLVRCNAPFVEYTFRSVAHVFPTEADTESSRRPAMNACLPSWTLVARWPLRCRRRASL